MPTKSTARQRATRRAKVERAFAALLAALDTPATGDMRDSPKRATALWLEHLLAGRDADVAGIIGKGSPHRGSAPVSVVRMGVHLVCPHHLTVAFGEAHVAYSPGGRVVGFGTLSELLRACTARFILQEDATQAVSDALVEHLGARAAVTLIDAEHPCHNIIHARSHRARAITLAQAGHIPTAKKLEHLLATATGRSRTRSGARS